jgi:hypothetical protein
MSNDSELERLTPEKLAQLRLRLKDDGIPSRALDWRTGKQIYSTITMLTTDDFKGLLGEIAALEAEIERLSAMVQP